MSATDWTFVVGAAVYVLAVGAALVWCVVDIVKGMFR